MVHSKEETFGLEVTFGVRRIREERIVVDGCVKLDELMVVRIEGSWHDNLRLLLNVRAVGCGSG